MRKGKRVVRSQLELVSSIDPALLIVPALTLDVVLLLEHREVCFGVFEKEEKGEAGRVSRGLGMSSDEEMRCRRTREVLGI